MPNTNPEAILVANSKIRPLADRFMRLYNHTKALEVQAISQGWLALFPADADTVDDGADVDGRQIVTNQNIRDMILLASTYITDMEANSNTRRTQASVVSVNPEDD